MYPGSATASGAAEQRPTGKVRCPAPTRGGSQRFGTHRRGLALSAPRAWEERASLQRDLRPHRPFPRPELGQSTDSRIRNVTPANAIAVRAVRHLNSARAAKYAPPTTPSQSPVRASSDWNTASRLAAAAIRWRLYPAARLNASNCPRTSMREGDPSRKLVAPATSTANTVTSRITNTPANP